MLEEGVRGAGGKILLSPLNRTLKQLQAGTWDAILVARANRNRNNPRDRELFLFDVSFACLS